MKAKPEGIVEQSVREKERNVVVTLRKGSGLEHEVRRTDVMLDGRTRAETKADMSAGDWNGAQRLVHYLLRIRWPASRADT